MAEAACSPAGRVFLIGTHHTYQYGVGSTYAKACSRSEEAGFRALIARAAKRYAVCGLAEELNEDGLLEHGVTESVVQQEAARLGLPHCFCEPSYVERAALGVLQWNDLRLLAWSNRWSTDELERRNQIEFRKRETVWCERLQTLNTWPVLFVCGADHVESFSALLVEHGLSVEVLAQCWEPPAS